MANVTQKNRRLRGDPAYLAMVDQYGKGPFFEVVGHLGVGFACFHKPVSLNHVGSSNSQACAARLVLNRCDDS